MFVCLERIFLFSDLMIIFAETTPEPGRQIPDWTCACGFFNTLPPLNADECDRCRHNQNTQRRPMCHYHAAIAEHLRADRYNHICHNCNKHFKYTDPNYDGLGVMMRETKRALSCFSNTCRYSTSFEDPREMKKDFAQIEKLLANGKIRKQVALERVDEILWNACMHLDIRQAGDHIAEMLNVIDSIIPDITSSIEYCAKMEDDYKKNVEKIKRDPKTFKVKSSDKKSTYLVNLEHSYCSCPGFTNHGYCKHLDQ